METLAVALRVLLSLAVVLGLLWVLHRRLTRGDRTRGTANPLQVVGRQSVGQKSSVVIIDVDGRRFLLGVTEQSVNVLHSTELHSTEVLSAERLSTSAESPASTSLAVEAGDTDFARSLAAAIRQPRPPVIEAGPRPELAIVSMLQPRRNGASNSASNGALNSASNSTPGPASGSGRLSGSILSPATWTQAASALRLSK